MSTVTDKALQEIVTQYPQMAPAMACVTPFMKLFDQSGISVSERGRGGAYFIAEFAVPLPDPDKTLQKWKVNLHSDGVIVSGYRNGGWAWISDTSTSYTYAEFAVFLQQISDKQKKARKRRKA